MRKDDVMKGRLEEHSELIRKIAREMAREMDDEERSYWDRLKEEAVQGEASLLSSRKVMN